MPFINIKMFPGRSEAQRRDLALKVGDAAMEALGIHAEAFVIAVEEVAREEWNEKVSIPEVDGNPNVIIKNKPREEW